MIEVRERTSEWIKHYNNQRLHESYRIFHQCSIC
ncbi:hypothetical protein [Chryseobacterium indoltheticum]